MSTSSPSAARPTTVTAAFWILVVASVLGVIAGIIGLTATSASGALDQLEAETRAGVGAAITIVAVGAIIGAALRVLFAWFMYRGHNWARIVLTVLGGLNVLSVLASAANAGILDWISLLVVVVAIVLMFLPASNVYFAEAKRARQQRV